MFCLPAGSAVAAESAFPSRPIRFVVPFPPGTTTDVVARLVSLRAADRLGQPIVVDTRAGASGTIGVETVARGAPDGYTWVLGTTTTHALARILNPKLGYDPTSDFAPVALLGDSPYFLTTNPALPASNVQEFITYARASAGNPPVFVRRAGLDPTVETINLYAPPLGVRLPVEIPQRRIDVHPGDVIVLHSDGIYDTRNATEDVYGLDRIAQVIREQGGSTAESLRDALLADVAAFRGTREQDDDVTLVVCRLM